MKDITFVNIYLKLIDFLFVFKNIILNAYNI